MFIELIETWHNVVVDAMGFAILKVLLWSLLLGWKQKQLQFLKYKIVRELCFYSKTLLGLKQSAQYKLNFIF